MGTVTNQILAILFVVISTAATFLMFYLWGFPFDKEKLRSTAPVDSCCSIGCWGTAIWRSTST